MAVDIAPVTDFHGSYRAWVKCAKCSEKLQRPYPVETMQVEHVAEKPEVVGSRYKWVIMVECHGETMRCGMEIPVWWGEGMKFQALAYLYAFVRGGNGVYTCEMRKGTRGASPGALMTVVR